VSEDWQVNIGSDAVEAEVIERPHLIHGGSALSLSLRVSRGTLPAGTALSLFPLDPVVHKDIPSLAPGDVVRITGLWRRFDGSVIATIQTVIAVESGLPELICDQS